MKMNFFMGCGILVSDPKIVIEPDGPVSAQFRLLTINGMRTGGRRIESMAFDFIPVLTYDREIIGSISDGQKGDFVMVKGAVSTGPVNRMPACVHYGKRNTLPGIITYITPTWININEKGCAIDDEGNFSNELALNKLKEFREVSNIMIVAGALCREPLAFRTDVNGNSKMSAYQLAVKRKYRLAGKTADDTADFPWVKR